MVLEAAPPFVISAFANAVLDQDYELAHSYLSAGLQQRIALTELRDTLLQAEEDTGAPVVFAWRNTQMNWRDWQACRDGAAAPDVFPDTFVSWSCLSFAGDLEPCYQIWCLVISDGKQERIGFFEISDPD